MTRVYYKYAYVYRQWNPKIVSLASLPVAFHHAFIKIFVLSVGAAIVFDLSRTATFQSVRKVNGVTPVMGVPERYF